jgi:hypothetical protein
MWMVSVRTLQKGFIISDYRADIMTAVVSAGPVFSIRTEVESTGGGRVIIRGRPILTLGTGFDKVITYA